VDSVPLAVELELVLGLVDGYSQEGVTFVSLDLSLAIFKKKKKKLSM
jgi:hypothetical protein